MRVGVAMDLDQVQRSLHVASIGELEAFLDGECVGGDRRAGSGRSRRAGMVTARHSTDKGYR